MKTISLNARRSHDADWSDDADVALIRITHPDLDAPVRLSTDPGREPVSFEPLLYGIHSTWLTDDGSPFLFALVNANPPGDADDGPQQASLTFSNVDNDIAKALRSFNDQATIDIGVVLAGSPDHVEAQFLGLKIVAASGEAEAVTLTISREPITAEPWPSGRMTRQRFPGLFP